MNLYDFDGTIYPTNCTVEFFLWCMNRHPKLLFTFLPKMSKYFALNRLGKMPEYLMYRNFLGFLRMIDDVEEQIERYWDKNEKKIALCAEKAHLVSNRATKISDWPKLDSRTMKKVNKKVDTGWNTHVKD